MDKLVIDSGGMMDDAQRAAALAKASEMAMADFAMLPVHFEHSIWAMKKGITFEGARTSRRWCNTSIPPGK